MPTDLKKLHDDIEADIFSSGRRDWRENIRRLRDMRLGERKKKLLYPNAPNFLEPIIDDNVRSITSAENQVLWSSRHLAHFMPLTPGGADMKRQAEVAFDTLLRFMLDFRAKVEALLDQKNCDGMAIAKLVENDEAMPRILGIEGIMPDFDQVDCLDFIVPTGTNEVHKASRATHINRYTESVLRKKAKRLNWKNIDQVIKECKGIDNAGTGPNTPGSGGSTQGDDRRGNPHLIQLNSYDPSEGLFVIWETYYEDKDSKRYKTISCPDTPEIEIHQVEWKWASKFNEEGDEIPQPDRRWPFFQMRFEGRSRDFYDTRGAAQLLEDNQKAATQFLNLRGVAYDFFSKPLLEGSSSTHNMANFRWRPGEKLPDGLKVAQTPSIDSQFNFDADIERASAQRRVGSLSGALSSVINQGRERKTATEVNQEAFASNLLTTDSIQRFSEPFGQMFNEMWTFLRHNPIPLPMIDSVKGQAEGMTTEDIFQHPFIILPASGTRTVNPDFALSQLSQLQPYFEGNPFIKVDELTRFVVDQMDPRLTERLVVTEEEQAPIQQQIQQMGEQMQQIGQVLNSHNDLLVAQAEEEEALDAQEAGMKSLESELTKRQSNAESTEAS